MDLLGLFLLGVAAYVGFTLVLTVLLVAIVLIDRRRHRLVDEGHIRSVSDHSPL